MTPQGKMPVPRRPLVGTAGDLVGKTFINFRPLFHSRINNDESASCTRGGNLLEHRSRYIKSPSTQLLHGPGNLIM